MVRIVLGTVEVATIKIMGKYREQLDAAPFLLQGWKERRAPIFGLEDRFEALAVSRVEEDLAVGELPSCYGIPA